MAKTKQRQVHPILRLYSEENYRGSRVTVRGAVAVRDLDRHFDADSYRFHSSNRNATLVIFSEENFQGRYRIIRGSHNNRDVDDMESFVMANFHITESQVRELQRTRRLPRYFRVY